MNNLILFIAWIGTTIFRGIVLSILWEWFIVPLGVISIGIFHAIGFSLLVSYLAMNITSIGWKQVIFTSFMLSLLALTFGFIFHSFM